MAGPEGGVWGNEVTVPEGEKLSAQTAQHVKPTGNGGDSPPEKTEAGDAESQQTPPDAPIVRLPDGTEVPVSDYDPYARQRQDLETREARVDGVLSAIQNGNGPQEDGDPPADPPHPLLADNPLLQKIELDPNDTLITEEERQQADRHNAVVDYAKTQSQALVEMETNFNKELGAIRETVGDRFVREDIARVTATTGVSEEELVGAASATGISDVETLATLVLGEKAKATAAEEAAAAAEAARGEANANIGSATQQGGGGGTQTQPEGRGVKDWRDAKAVGAAYKFGA